MRHHDPIDRIHNLCDNQNTMNKKKPGTDTMTDLLRQALEETGNHKLVARETGVARQSILRFARGDQSLRLDAADTLARYFNITCRRERK